MTNLATLQSLRDRVANATGPDREIDGLIYIASFIPSERVGRLDHDGGVVGWWPKDGPYVSAIEVPRYTSSIDAALGWVERVLPLSGMLILRNATNEVLAEGRPDSHLPRAIVLAGLDALIAKEKTDD